jgi:hypothetical protein
MNTSALEIWNLDIYDFFTYLDVLKEESEAKSRESLSEEDKILLGYENKIASDKDIKEMLGNY